jgi:hypothetical protein
MLEKLGIDPAREGEVYEAWPEGDRRIAAMEFTTRLPWVIVDPPP